MGWLCLLAIGGGGGHKEALVGFTRITVNSKFHSWFPNFKLP